VTTLGAHSMDPAAGSTSGAGAGSGPDQPPERPRLWRGRHLLYLTGLVFMAVGLKGIVHNTNHWENPTYWAKLFIGVDLAHDLVWAAVVALVAVVTNRLLPRPIRRLVQTGLAMSLIVFALFYPALRGYGRDATNPSVDPLNYARGLEVALGVVWAGVLVTGLALWWRRRR
jgi:hypothetical protein